MPARKLNLESGAQLPVQHREYKIDKAKIDSEKRTVEILFSTDDPAERWFGNEVLDHSPGACDLRRLNDGAAFLKDHDSRMQIGVHESASINVVAAGTKQRGEGRAVVRFAPSSNALAEQEFRDMLAGVRTKISVGYVAREMKLVEEDDDGNETWLVTKWEPLENSLVAIPLDPACAAGRAAETDKQYPVTLIRSSENNSHERENSVDAPPNESHKRENQPTPMETPEEKAAREAREAKQRERDEADAARERSEKIQEGVKAAREREVEIRAIGKRATVPEEKKSEFERHLAGAIEKAITDPNAVADFRTFVFDNFFGKAEPLDTPSAKGGADIKVVGERNGWTPGQHFVNSEQFKRAMNGKTRLERVSSVEIPFPMLGVRGRTQMLHRAGFTSGDLSAINVAPQQTLVGLGVERLTIMDLIAPGTTDKAAIPYPRENSFGTVDGVAVAAGAMPRAKSVGERGVKPTWDPDVTTETANVKKVAVTTPVPDEFMEDFPGFQSFIDQRLPYMVDMETEVQMLYGDGLGNNLKGVMSTSGVQTRAYATSWGDTLKKAITDVEVGSFFMADGIAMHPYDFEVASLEKDVNGQYLMGGPVYLPYGVGQYVQLYNIWGKPVVSTTSVAVGKPVVGAWKLGAQYFIRSGMRLETTNSNEDDFKRNLLRIRAEHRLALAVYRPVAFLEITGGPVRT